MSGKSFFPSSEYLQQSEGLARSASGDFTMGKFSSRLSLPNLTDSSLDNAFSLESSV